MLDAGEDRLFIARRLVRAAIEDIGLADPQALAVANAAKDAFDFLALPEASWRWPGRGLPRDRPKSNALYTALQGRPRTAAGTTAPYAAPKTSSLRRRSS
jgi:putative ATPase